MQNMNMKKVLMGTLVCSGVLLASCSDNPEVASTEAGRIRQEDFYERLKNEPMQGGATYGEQILQQMLIEDILENAYGDQVDDEDIDSEIEVMAEQYGGVEELELLLEQDGMSLDDIRANLRVNLQLREAVRDHVEFTDEDLQELHEQNSVVPEGTRVAHILVEDEETANEVIDELNDGADFAELVQEYSQDPGSLETDGEYDLVAGQMVAEFEEAAMELAEGETTQEPVESMHGFHIIRMIELGEEVPFEDARDDLEDQLLDQYLQTDTALVNEIMYELVQDANVQISDEDLQGAMAAFMTPPQEEEISDDLLEELPIDEEVEETSEDTEEEQEDTEEEDSDE